MGNETGARRPHPLESKPTPPPTPERHPTVLHIPSVQPTLTQVLIVINVAIFVLRALSPALNQQFFEWGANNPVRVLVDGEYHRLFTAMFLHASIYLPDGTLMLQSSMHLIFNMYALYLIGSDLERIFGHRRFITIYLLGGLGGSVLSAILNPANVYSVGASGAVFALFGTEFVYLYKHRKLLGAMGRARLRSVIMLGIINFGIGILSTFDSGGVNIDNWGHLGGLLGGVGLAWFIAPYFIPRRHAERPNELQAYDINPIEKRWWVVSVYSAVLLAILIIATLWLRGG